MLAQRYAVRFIMLNNFDELKKLAKLMVKFGVESLDLEELIDEDDEWITKDMLRSALMRCKTSTFVTPFSEIVRFYNDDDFRGFFNDIMLMEDVRNPQKRIYVPLIGLQNRFTYFLNHFARIEKAHLFGDMMRKNKWLRSILRNLRTMIYQRQRHSANCLH